MLYLLIMSVAIHRQNSMSPKGIQSDSQFALGSTVVVPINSHTIGHTPPVFSSKLTSSRYTTSVYNKANIYTTNSTHDYRLEKDCNLGTEKLSLLSTGNNFKAKAVVLEVLTDFSKIV